MKNTDEENLIRMMMAEEMYYLDGKRGYRMARRGTDRNPGEPNDHAYGCIGDSKDIRLPSCHYTDDRYKHAQTVFGRRRDGLSYDYSDRFPQWDSTKWNEGHEKAKEMADRGDIVAGSVRYYEIVLSYFHNAVEMIAVDPADLTSFRTNPTVSIEHVLIGFNWSNGFSYQVYGYHFPNGAPWDKKKAEEEAGDEVVEVDPESLT